MFARFLNGLIRFSLRQRLFVAVLAMFLLVYGGWRTLRLPIDVFPDLNRPRVTVMTEAPGLAPEEVETLITFPLETALNGAPGVQAVRSQSGVGLSVIQVEFDWGTDPYTDRQIVTERTSLAASRLPTGVVPQLAPISSVMGQIMIAGMWSEGEKTSPMELRTLADRVVGQRLRTIRGVSEVFVMGGERKQFQVLVNPKALNDYGVTLRQLKDSLAESNRNATGGYLDQQGPNELLVRSLGRIQSVDEIEDIVVAVHDARAVLVKQLARVVEGPQVKRGDGAAFARDENGTFQGGPAVVLTINKQPGVDTRQVTAEVTAALCALAATLPPDVRIEPSLYQQKGFIDLAIDNVIAALRDGSLLVFAVLFLFLLNVRTTFISLTAIPLSIVATGLVFSWCGLSINTMTLGGLAVAIGELVDDAIVDVENIFRRLKENRASEAPLHPLVVVYRASAEVRNSIVYSTALVVLVFIPVFALNGMEGRLFAPLGVAYIVSILASMVVSLTVTPVLSYWLLGRKGFWPWFAAVIAPLIAVVATLWLAPAVCDWLGLRPWAEWLASQSWRFHAAVAVIAGPVLWILLLLADRVCKPREDGPVLRLFKTLAGGAMRISLRFPYAVLVLALAAVVVEGVVVARIERDFLPPFNEGAVQINVVLPPGTSLTTSKAIAARVEERLKQIGEIRAFVRRTGRAELDEHAVPVSISEIIATLDPRTKRSRESLLHEIREALADVPGIVTSVEQPLAHLISHMLSGVQAQIAVKVYGDDLGVLRRTAQQMQAAMATVPGVTDLLVEPQVEIPQLRIEINGDQLRKYGLRRADVNELVETALGGETVSEVLQGQRSFDLVVRLDEPMREDLDAVRRLTIQLPDGGTTTLESVAKIYQASGPNTINREKVRRRIVVQCNATGRGLVDVVADIKTRLQPIERALPRDAGYFIEYGGQFESQQSAAWTISVLFLVALVGMFLVLEMMFRSANLALQVLLALPMAFIGAVAALWLTGQTLTVAAMIGFISLCGIASRNGILLINHYLHLVVREGEDWTQAMILRAGRERVAPVLMTALTSGIGLLPLAMAAGEPGKEILYPVATVIIGGLLSSTLLEFFVRPAMFWKFGCGAAARVVAEGREAHALDAEEETE